MDELAHPSVITAIADAEFEGMVSSAIFAAGWDVISRPLDFTALNDSLAQHIDKKVLVIYSVDLPGFNIEQIRILSQENVTFLGFCDVAGSNRGFSDVSQRPSQADDFLAHIRGNIRSPILRVPLLQSRPNIKARIIAVGSAGPQTGATTLAINLAHELSLLAKRTLLIDANSACSAIADLLDLRKIAEEEKWRDISEFLSVAEITQKSIPEFPMRAIDAANYFDYIIIDLGSLQNIGNDLSDRRWASQVKIWAARFAQDIYLTAGTDFIQRKQLKKISSEFAEIRLPARISIFMKPSDILAKRERSKPVDVHPLTPESIQYLPVDARLCDLARTERTTFSESNDKAQLRKAIAALAAQITE